jgi:hypothetical protein
MLFASIDPWLGIVTSFSALFVLELIEVGSESESAENL